MMYCPSCGNPVSEGLKYCNRCGASLAGEEGGPGPAGLAAGPAWAVSLAVALVTLGGLSMLFVLALVLLKRGGELPPSAGIMGLAFLALIAFVDWLLVRQLARVIDVYRGGAAAPKRRAEPARAPAELDERRPARLEAPHESYISVTEQTTRTLEHAPRERDTRPQPQ